MGLILQFHLTDSNRAFTCILLVSFEFESSPSFSRLKYCVVGMDLALPLYSRRQNSCLFRPPSPYTMLRIRFRVSLHPESSRTPPLHARFTPTLDGGGGLDLCRRLSPGDDKIHATRATRGGAGNSLSAAREADVYSS